MCLYGDKKRNEKEERARERQRDYLVCLLSGLAWLVLVLFSLGWYSWLGLVLLSLLVWIGLQGWLSWSVCWVGCLVWVSLVGWFACLIWLDWVCLIGLVGLGWFNWVVLGGLLFKLVMFGFVSLVCIGLFVFIRLVGNWFVWWVVYTVYWSFACFFFFLLG